MKLRTSLTLVFSIFACLAHAERISFVGGTLINPGTSQVLENSVVVVDGDRITAAGTRKEMAVPTGSKRIDCKGKFILPGYIDTHVHFFQSGGLFTRPDIVDLTKVRSYAEEIAWIKKNLPDTFARYLRCGITSVVDVGGPFWNFEVRKQANATAKAPRVAVAGPLISSVSRPQLDLGDPPIVKIDNPEQAREFVRKLAEQKPDLVKIWYIVNDEHPVDSFRPIVRATAEESHARKIRVAVHATELETARAAVEEGADVLVHSVIDKEVDDAFVKLLKDRHTILCPTLVVFERYGRTFANKLNLTRRKSVGQSGSDRDTRRDKNRPGAIARSHQNRAGQSGCGTRSNQKDIRCRAEETENIGRCRRHYRRRHRCWKHRHHSRAGALSRISVDERSRPERQCKFCSAPRPTPPNFSAVKPARTPARSTKTTSLIS